MGFLFLILYPAPASRFRLPLPPPAPASRPRRLRFVTHSLPHNFVTHTIFHTQLCHTPSFTRTHHLPNTTLSHTTSSHTIFHAQLCHTPSSTHRLWQAWHFTTSTFALRGKRGTSGAGLGWWGAWAPCGRRLGAAGRAVTPRHFAWQAWHLATSTFTLHGRRGTWRHPSLCVAGVALHDIHPRFAWQAWHFTTSTVVSRGRRGTWSHRPSFCVACLAMFDGNFGKTFWHVYRDAWFEPCLAMCYCKPCLIHVLQLLACLTFCSFCKKNRCVFMPYARANELVVSDLPNSFPSHLSLSPILPVRD